MTGVGVTIKNGQALRDKLGKFTAKVPLLLNQALFTAAAAVAKEAQRLLQDNAGKTGILYPELRNRSSAPGEAPALQTGALASSIKFEPSGAGYRVYADENIAPYAGWLEHGHFDESGKHWTEPRPFMQPAFDTVKPTVDELVSGAWKATFG